MGKMERILLLLVSVLLLSTSLPVSLCAKKPVAAPRKEDIPYIKCQVCEKPASQLYQQVQSKQAQISPKKISEYQIIEIAENVCNLKKEEADWILKIDVVMGYSDTDVAEYIYTSKPDTESLANYLCKDLTKACKTKPPQLPTARTPGEPFVPKPTKEAEMEKMLRSMEGIPGAPSMKMYSREELMNNNFGEDADDDDDDDDEDEDRFPSNLGKPLRDKESKKGDWKQTIVRGVKDAGETLKRHATKVSFRVQKWWKGYKTSRSKAASKAEL
ncbi:RNA polymerase II C-terminal domain phosphatase-like protein [Hibiscus syriacus]|uniref:RNA polymerase II C-terminal domain phosphatase-like protein n=1 Tax=Hibiscus syriacus TaxID=106335 RepID=A0A6A2Z6C5_HIBSY|nr:RNA polymerase II C-terminal domain phosphatase-like protein [Hibiscus syriacus]